MQRKRNIGWLLLLLLLVTLLIFYVLQKPKEKKIVFAIQGQTILQAGSIDMKIWDNNTEDGDSVAVYIDGRLIADSIPILYEPLLLSLGKLKTGEHLLGVKAISVGMNAPATATISLNDGKGPQEFIMDAWIDSAAGWKIIVR
jgi:hypothetical protein